MWIKVILITGIVCVGILMLRTGASDRNAALRRLGMTAFSVLAVILVIYPSITTKMANMVGVQRGADLVFYLLVLAFLGSLLTAAQRNVAVDRRITRLARDLALANAKFPTHQSDTVISEENSADSCEKKSEPEFPSKTMGIVKDSSETVQSTNEESSSERSSEPVQITPQDSASPASTEVESKELVTTTDGESSVFINENCAPLSEENNVENTDLEIADMTKENADVALGYNRQTDISHKLRRPAPGEDRDAAVQRLLATIAASRANLAGQDLPSNWKEHSLS